MHSSEEAPPRDGHSRRTPVRRRQRPTAYYLLVTSHHLTTHYRYVIDCGPTSYHSPLPIHHELLYRRDALGRLLRGDPLVAPHLDDSVVRHRGVPGGRAHTACDGARRERHARATGQLGVRAGAAAPPQPLSSTRWWASTTAILTMALPTTGTAVRGRPVLWRAPRLHPRPLAAAVRPPCLHAVHVPLGGGGGRRDGAPEP